MKKQSPGSRLDLTGAAVKESARSLGWTDQADPHGSSPMQRAVAITKADELSVIVADLAQLVEVGAASDWWVGQLSVSKLTQARATVAVVFSGGRRVVTSRAMAASAARRRASGGRLGRPSSIQPELLDRIVTAKLAGKSYRAIAADLEEEGVPTPSGARQWYGSTVRAAHLRRLSAG